MELDTTPRTNWPSKSGKYKVVQLEFDKQPYLRFGLEDDYAHATILMELLYGLGIEFGEIKSRSGSNVPALEGQRYKVHGMCRADVDADNRRASLYGDSFDYRIGIDRQHLEALRAVESGWLLEVLE